MFPNFRLKIWLLQLWRTRKIKIKWGTDEFSKAQKLSHAAHPAPQSNLRKDWLTHRRENASLQTAGETSTVCIIVRGISQFLVLIVAPRVQHFNYIPYTLAFVHAIALYIDINTCICAAFCYIRVKDKM